MRQTPRHQRSSRSIGTLIGNGWLREQPRVATPNKWDIRGKSALRKCMFMAVPDELRRLVPPSTPRSPQVMAAHLAPHLPPARAEEILVHRHDPRKDAREFPAYVPGGVIDPRLAAQQAHAAHVRNAQKEAVAAAGKPPLAWWEDPVALGSLLILVPPIGLAAVWSSKRYSSDARWALTVMTALTMCLMSAVLIAALAMR
jgi:hypothetical protein